MGKEYDLVILRNNLAAYWKTEKAMKGRLQNINEGSWQALLKIRFLFLKDLLKCRILQVLAQQCVGRSGVNLGDQIYTFDVYG